MGRYAAAIFVGAFLLFQVQPLIARCILPWYGGTPAVWTTCMLFFQVLLLLGYLYSHLVITGLRPRGQVAVHSLLLVASIVAMAVAARSWGTPIVPSAAWKPQSVDLPMLRILLLLSVAVGLPYFVLATTSPLLQAWFSRTKPGVSPYRLYSLSNAGSLLALLTYPVVVEPRLALRAQAFMWSAAYAVFVVLGLICAAMMWRARGEEKAQAGEADDGVVPSWRRKLLWVALPAGASTLLLATTNQLCEDVSVIPFLWVMPLGLYLLSFILCFDKERWYSRRWYVTAMALALGAITWVMLRGVVLPIMPQVVAYAAVLFICCMVCHGELVALKPSAKYLTSFYLALALGGALGGVFVGVAAPMLFDGFWELQLSLAFCAIVGAGVALRYRELWRPIGKPVASLFAATAVAILLIPWFCDRGTVTLPDSRTRNFYGQVEVDEMGDGTPADERYVLRHGRTWHGWQYLSAERRHIPTSYFGTTSGIGLMLLNHPRRTADDAKARDLRIGVVGLGAGSLAVYGRAGDYMRFYEINPAVIKLSGPEGYFSYVGECEAGLDIVEGDARLSLEREAAHGGEGFDVLILDAFNSDAVPVHLMTKEFFEVCLANLRDTDSVLAVQVTNRALDLRPVVYKLAEATGMAAALIIHREPGGGVTCSADWMLLCRNPRVLQAPAIASATSHPTDLPKVGLWTDDYHSIFSIIRWRG